MVTSGEKMNPAVNSRQPQAVGSAFFRKTGEHNFFGAREIRSFFGGNIQAKLTVSQPNDPQEKEADDMADHVMRMPEPVHAIHRSKEEEKLDRREEKEEEHVQRAADKEIDRQEEDQPVHAKADSNTLFAIQRSQEKEEEKIHTKCEACQNDEKKDGQKLHAKLERVGLTQINRKRISLYHSDVIQRSGRGPPGDSIQFEQALSSSKGSGDVLPENTKQFMESRFNTDFSGVRIHTGSTAEQLTTGVHAKAFAHGNDIYFNKGQFSPASAEGGTLLAHELTHTIQQGAGKSNVSSKNTPQAKTKVAANSFSISKKDIYGSMDTIPGETRRMPSKTREPNTTKTGLSSWHVNAEGHLQKSADHVHLNDNKKLLRKDEKEKKEEENQVSSTQPGLQKKQAEDIQSKYDNGIGTESIMQTSFSSNTETEVSNSSLNSIADGSKSVINNEQDRGPPSVQLKLIKGGSVIQREGLGSALNAVAGAFGEAAAFVGQGLDAAKKWMLEKIKASVQNIPGYNILGLILRYDPVTHAPVERSGRNILLAGLQLIPGGNLFRQVLERLKAIDEAGAWIEARIGDLLALVSGIGNMFTQFMDHLSLSDISDPELVLNRVADLFGGVFNAVKGFFARAAVEFLEMIKRIMLRLIVDFVQKKMPGLYPLLRVALGHDPVTGEEVPRNGRNILYAVLDATDEGREQRKQMEDTGSFDKAAAWIDKGIAVFTKAYGFLRQAFTNLWASVTIENLFSPEETFKRIYEDFARPVDLVKDFLVDVAKEIIRLVKDGLLKRLSDYARGKPGYYLVTVIIGKDPFTGEVVSRSVANIIHGFMGLMEGGEEQYKQMEQSGAVARATQQVEAAVAKLNMTPEYVIGLFINLWQSFGLKDLAHPVDAFMRIMQKFGEPIGRLINFVIEIVKIVVHVILQIMNFPFDLINNIIAKAMQAFELIKKDPIGFLKNLLRAIKEGFMQFFDHILTHLFTGLKAWFLSEVKLAGIPVPKDFSAIGILKWLLAVLDITMEKIWKKLEERIGKPKVDKIKKMIATVQKVAGAAGDALAFMEDVQKRGFLEVMIDKVKEQLSNVWDLVLNAVQSFVMDQIIKKVTAKLLSMLDPTGIMAVINGAIALYKAIESFKRYLVEMLKIVNSFVEGTLQIAQGATKNAADFLEGALAQGVPVVIGFLANQVGLKLSERLKDALELVRAKVDKGLTWAIDKVVIIVEKLIAFITGKNKKDGHSPEKQAKIDEGIAFMHQEQSKYLKDGKITKNDASKVAATVKANHPVFSSFTIKEVGKKIDFLYTASPETIADEKDESDDGSLDANIQVGTLILVQFGDRQRVAKVEYIENDKRMIKYVIEKKLAHTTTFDSFKKIFIEIYIASKRLMYMGPTPGKRSDVGRKVISRMRGEGKITGVEPDEQVKYGDLWYNISGCDMSHIIGAAKWWEDGGKELGPRSDEAIAFMNNDKNYILEPLGPNRARGSKEPRYSAPPKK
jgi:hypothetical protein